jgi:hypothetical protein
MATTKNFLPADVPIAEQGIGWRVSRAWLHFFQRINNQASDAGPGDVTASGTLTDHEVVLGDGTTEIRTLGTTGVAGRVLTSHGAGADPQWDAVSAGTVTTTGSPASGNLTKFSGATSITNADLTGDVTTSGTVATTLANTAVMPGTYGDDTHVAQFTVDSKGRLIFAQDVAILGLGVSYIPLSLGVEPLTFVSDGAGSPILIPFTP